MLDGYKWIPREEPDTAQTLACSSNVTKDVNLAVTEERSGIVDARSQRCPPGLSPAWHTKLMKSDYMHTESAALDTSAQLGDLCVVHCTTSRKKQQKAVSSLLKESLTKHLINMLLLFFVDLLQEVGSIIGKVCFFH